ncbi:MAG TPA: hypothetical protein PKZ53_15265, partial [Acidobacteriota bacterium]|nr:hypothetical protein [Acidobacteriota bacterium]
MGNFRLVAYLRNFLLKVSRVPREQRFYTFILAAPTATAKIHRFQLPHHLLCVVCVLAALGALTVLAGAGLDALINLSASPYHRGKLPQRVKALSAAASRVGAPLL